MKVKRGANPVLQHYACYEIIVSEELQSEWASRFGDMEIRSIALEPAGFGTRLSGPVADQAALRGILNKIWNLNLTVISVKRLDLLVGEQV